MATAEPFSIHGNVVIIDHGFGVFSIYVHLSDFMVERGAWVQYGQVIGLAGFSGRASGPHLQFEIVVNGVPVDPISWMALAPGFVPPSIAPSTNPPGS